MSFPVPVKSRINSGGRIFRIISKQFVRQLTAKNGFDDNKNYTVYGRFVKDKDVVVFHMAEAFENCRNENVRH